MTTIIEIARRHVGRRYKITRKEMAEILAAMHREGLDLRNDCMSKTHDLTEPYVLEHGYPESQHAPQVWANACTGITCISVLAAGCIPHGQVRYDDPGSMAPLQRATLMFVPEELGHHEYDQIGQLRRKADRVLVVREGPPLATAAETPAELPAWIARFRRQHPRVDGTWARIHDDGMLELRDPNDGQSSDPADKCRHQYRVARDGNIVTRRLPPESVGDQWVHIGPDDLRPHEWELSQTPPVDDLLYAWWEEQVL